MTERNIPSHYDLGDFEAKDVISSVLNNLYEHDCPNADTAYYLGSALKYLLRCTRKGEFKEDLEKARTFIGFILDE